MDGQITKSKIITISFSTLRKKLYYDPDIFISARAKPLRALRSEIIAHLPIPSPTSPTTQSQYSSETWTKNVRLTITEYIIVIDTLNPLAATQAAQLPNFLSSLLLGANISLLASYHTDIPLPSRDPYQSDPLMTLNYVSTAILTVQNLSQVLARKAARDRSLQPPEFGLAEHREGVLVGLSKSAHKKTDGIVIEMEIRRKSGRGVSESFVLSPPNLETKGKLEVGNIIGNAILLDDHPAYSFVMGEVTGGAEKDDEVETTFSLGLSEKQRRDREGVVLPYFDAQKEGGVGGPGEGGRILYEMGAEDREDFDDEEDEI